MNNQTTPTNATPNASAILTQYTQAQTALKQARTANAQRPTAKTAKAVDKALKRLESLKELANVNGIIAPFNVESIGERIAIKALKTCYQKGGQPFIYSLYCGLVADVASNKTTAPLSDGYDVAQTATAFLCGYMGQRLTDATTDGQTDKDGNPVSIMRACFRAVNRYIMSERTREYKKIYVDDIGKDGERVYYEIPDSWDAPTATDYKRIIELIELLKLSTGEKRFISYRLKGFSLDTIAQKMSVKRDTLNTYRKRIKAKAQKIGLTPTQKTTD